MASHITASGRARASRRRQTTTTRTLISEVQLNRRSGKIVYRVVLTLVIVGFTLVFIGPLYFLFTDGLKSTQEAIATPPTLYPHALHPSNYVQAWNRLDVGRMLWNSVYYAAGALAFQLVFDVTAAYSLSKLRPVFGNVVLFLMLATLMIPATVLVLPQYVTIPQTRLILTLLLMLQVVATMQMFIESFVLTNGGGGVGDNTQSVVMLIYQYAFAMSGASNYNSASALGVVLMLVLAVFSGGFLWVTRERG